MGLHPFARYRHLLWITTLVLAVSGTLLLAACGTTTNTNPSTSTPTATATQQQESTPTPTPSSGSNTYQVSIVGSAPNFSFSPATLTIPKGATVTWTNNSDAPHTVTSDNNAFTGSGTLSQSQTFQMVFTTAGTYMYHCTIHSNMNATIIVTS